MKCNNIYIYILDYNSSRKHPPGACVYRIIKEKVCQQKFLNFGPSSDYTKLEWGSTGMRRAEQDLA